MFLAIPEGIDRFQYWTSFINEKSFESVAEIGVWRGAFAKAILDNCSTIRDYYLVDPWRKMDDWNKPFNFKEDFEKVYQQAMNNLKSHQSKTKLLRGKTTEVIDQIPNNSLDFAYVDGDHTLRGIAIDLMTILPKMKTGSFIGLDDFTNPLQHGFDYELSLVDPFGLYFAEANRFPCAILGKGQFCIHVDSSMGFSLVDFKDPDRSTPYPDIITRLSQHKVIKLGKKAQLNLPTK